MSHTIEEVQEELDFYRNLTASIGLGQVDRATGYEVYGSQLGTVVYFIQYRGNPDGPPIRVLTSVRVQVEDTPTSLLSPLVVEPVEEPEEDPEAELTD